VNYWTQRADVPAKQIVAWLGVGGSKYFDRKNDTVKPTNLMVRYRETIGTSMSVI